MDILWGNVCSPKGDISQLSSQRNLLLSLAVVLEVSAGNTAPWGECQTTFNSKWSKWEIVSGTALLFPVIFVHHVNMWIFVIRVFTLWVVLPPLQLLSFVPRLPPKSKRSSLSPLSSLFSMPRTIIIAHSSSFSLAAAPFGDRLRAEQVALSLQPESVS